MAETSIEVEAAWWVAESIQDIESFGFGVSAGLGSGKSHGKAQWAFDRVRKNQGCRFSGSLWPTYQKIHDAALPIARKVLEQFGLREWTDFRVLKSPFPKLVYLDQEPNHEVHFISAENPEKIVAVEYCHGDIDEAGIIKGVARDLFISRVRDPIAKIRQVMEVGAPQGVNDFAEKYDSDTLDGWDRTEKFDHRHVEKRLRRFKLWTDHNPYLPPDYVQQIVETFGHNPNLLRSYRYGEFCPLTTGAAYSNYFPQKHDLDKDIEPSPYRDVNLTWDFNAYPLAWISLQKVAFEEYGERVHRYVGIHESNLGARQLDEAVAEFAAKHPVHQFKDTLIILEGDRSGYSGSHKITGSDYENIERQLRAYGYNRVEIRAMKSNPLEVDSVEALQRAFAKCWLYLCPRLRNTRRSLMSTTWAEGGKRKLHKPTDDTWTHWSDGLKYFAYRNLRDGLGPQTYGINR